MPKSYMPNILFMYTLYIKLDILPFENELLAIKSNEL